MLPSSSAARASADLPPPGPYRTCTLVHSCCTLVHSREPPNPRNVSPCTLVHPGAPKRRRLLDECGPCRGAQGNLACSNVRLSHVRIRGILAGRYGHESWSRGPGARGSPPIARRERRTVLTRRGMPSTTVPMR